MPDPKAAVNTNATLKPGGFHHVALLAPNFEKSVDFYQNVLGCTPAALFGEAPNRGALLDAGDGNYIEIFERIERGEVPGGLKVMLAAQHFALRCTDCAGLLEKVRAAGCVIEQETKTISLQDKLHDRTLELTIAFFTGPCGELVELFENDVL